MLPRPTPIEAHPREPWSRWDSGDPLLGSLWMKRPAVRTCGLVSEWAADVARETIALRERLVALAQLEDATAEQAIALLNQLRALNAGLSGYVVGACWAHPTMTLAAIELHQRGAYSYTRQPNDPEGFRPASLLPTHDVDGLPIVRSDDPRVAFGVEVYDELIGDGWAPGQIEAVASGMLARIQAPLGRGATADEVGEWASFSKAQPEATVSPSSM